MKAFKFRLYPTDLQAVQLNQHIGSCRFVYNWALDQEIRSHRSKPDWIVTPAERGEEPGDLPSIVGGMNQDAR